MVCQALQPLRSASSETHATHTDEVFALDMVENEVSNKLAENLATSISGVLILHALIWTQMRYLFAALFCFEV
eukprot:scaffold189939_cov19-Tisochrysis_lutea.AAC.6